MTARVQLQKKEKERVIGEPWFPKLTLKTLLNWDLYWNK
jgi:hypothetical protein